MSRQLAPIVLILAAVLADAAGRSDVALYALLVSVPVIAVIALDGYGRLVAGEGGNLAETSLWVLALVLVTAGASVPSFWNSALVTCLVLAGTQGLERQLRRRLLGDVDQRLHDEERPDRHGHAGDHGRLQRRLARR